jgi:putative phage-type endonuclease
LCDGRDEWLGVRRNYIGASDAAGILGEGYAGQSRYSIWADKCGYPCEEMNEKRLRIGKLMEPALRRIFEEETEVICRDPGEHTVLVSREWPWMAATLDGIAVCDDRGPLPVELKNVGHFMRDEWDKAGPLKYQIQVQHQLAVTGAPAAYLFGLIGGNEPAVILCERNESFIAALADDLYTFWQLVQNQTPPEVDGSDSTAKALKRLHPNDNGEAVLLPIESLEWDSELADVKRQLKDVEAREQLLKNRIVAAIGDATFGVLPNGQQYSYKTQTRAEYVCKSSTFRVLRKAKGK